MRVSQLLMGGIISGAMLFVGHIGAAAVMERVMEYKIDGKDFEGFLAWDDAQAKAPGILVVHNWMGVTDTTKEKARDLAKLGYVAFAADIYGKGIRPKDAKEASAQATIYKTDRKLFRKRLNAGL